jgi:hypothetical protein
MEERNPSAPSVKKPAERGFFRRHVNPGGLLATVLSFLLFLERSFEDDQDVQAMMTLSGTVLLLIWSFFPGRRWWQGLLAWLAGCSFGLLPLLSDLRYEKTSAFYIACFIGFPLLFPAFMRPKKRAEHNAAN